MLFSQNNASKFAPLQTIKHTESYTEIIDAEFFDANGDGFLDLYLAAGGNEFEARASNYRDKLYLNNGFGYFTEDRFALPQLNISSGVVLPMDYDNDGDEDLFIGGRLVPGKYPLPESSYILRNDSNGKKVQFVNVSREVASTHLEKIGMVTDAQWKDITGDGEKDLIIVGEWMPVTILKKEKDAFVPLKQESLEQATGWWNSVIVEDFDNDGDLDIIAGNLGLNYKYKASSEEPFEVYSSDFDTNGSRDIVLGYYENGILYPLRGKECSSQQIPQIKEDFTTYHDFASANLKDIYKYDDKKDLTHYEAKTFASIYFENNEGGFNPKQLPNAAQFSNINSIISEDFNYDGYLDLLVAGNMYVSEVETPRNDASYGMLLMNDTNGFFKSIMLQKSGLLLEGDVRNTSAIRLQKNKNGYLFAKNNGAIQLITGNN